MLWPARWLERLASPRWRFAPPTVPPAYCRACPCRGLPQPESAITTPLNHPLSRPDLHLHACQILKAAHRNLLFHHEPEHSRAEALRQEKGPSSPFGNEPSLDGRPNIRIREQLPTQNREFSVQHRATVEGPLCAFSCRFQRIAKNPIAPCVHRPGMLFLGVVEKGPDWFDRPLPKSLF